MDIRHFNIPAPNMQEVESKLNKLNKRAFKLGIEEISWVWGKAYLNSDEKLLVPIELSGPLHIQYEDWEFVATLQHLTTGENILRSIDNSISIPKEFRETGPICQHCLINRYRKDTYLIRNINSNTIVQVGSSCIKDFLGGFSPDNILHRAELVSSLMEYMTGSSGSFGHTSEDLYYLTKVLSQTSACIRDYGWVSKSKAQEYGKTATVNHVYNNFDPPTKDFVCSIVTDDDKKLAIEVADWAENLPDYDCEASDYLHNIRAIARSGMVGYRTMGFAASMVSAYKRATEPVKPKLISNHVGSIKERKIFDLVLKHDYDFMGHYGMSYKYIFEDANGNIMVWGTSNKQDFVRGQKYSIKGTIKDHSEFKGTKQTILSRCEVLN